MSSILPFTGVPLTMDLGDYFICRALLDGRPVAGELSHATARARLRTIAQTCTHAKLRAKALEACSGIAATCYSEAVS